MDQLKETILKKAHISLKQLERALNTQRRKGISLRDTLVAEGAITAGALTELFSDIYMPPASLDGFRLDPELSGTFPEHMARLYSAVPLFRNGDTLFVATSDPLNVLILDEMAVFCRCSISLMRSSEKQVEQAIERLYGGVPDRPSGRGRVSRPLRTGRKGPEKLADIILGHALTSGASDIHVEPESDCLRVRYRLDGMLRDILRIPKEMQDQVLARLKLFSGFEITENHIPQNGKLKLKAGEREVEFRVSSLPTAFGQKFVLHILDRDIMRSGLGELGFSENSAATIRSAIARPSGLLLFSGPAGSGKTGTLYSILNQLNTPEKDIVTVEDSVDLHIDGITQFQTGPDAGRRSPYDLRAILRQGPDVLMIDQIKERGSADTAVKAALSGKLVLAALQSRDAVSGIGLLVEMGIEPFLIGSSLTMVCCQRLARKLCPECRKLAPPPKELLGKKGFGREARFYSSCGCAHCNYTGFSGRVAVSETFLIDEEIRDIIIYGRPVEQIRKYLAKVPWYSSLRDDACLKAQSGLISPDEAISIASGE
ncbi:MAG: GspE/PulE family protein [Candidatus Omnitrophica bacterium]|nr:GspE/PulE family protein [Candidatus Omnitrophota bacterium]MDD5771576.1 GspE/PulE family protein [Candidatus Omnitrophota bacterium]